MGGARPREPGRCSPGGGWHADSKCRRFEEEDERSGAGKAPARRLLRQTRSAHVISGTRTGVAEKTVTVRRLQTVEGRDSSQKLRHANAQRCSYDLLDGLLVRDGGDGC